MRPNNGDRDMRVIGITGGIGTGKSTILRIMEEMGAYVLEADSLAHNLMEPGQPAYIRITEFFGNDIIREDGTIDRGRLGQLVFQNPEALEQLNGIVHPAVKEFILRDIEEKKKSGKVRWYVIEAALLIEDGYRLICDELWYIHAEKEVRIERLLSGRGGTREKWEQVMANQSADEFYRANCDVVIDNGNNLKKTINMVKDLLS